MKRAVGYVRESTEEQGQNWAPDVQRKAIRNYAAEHEWELTHLYQDFISGRNAEKRPDFQRLMKDAADRRFEVVLVYHSSRFARNIFEARQYKELLRKKLGVDVISVTQNFGQSDDPSSFLMEGLSELLDEHYSRNLGHLISAGLQEKGSQGYLLGSLPYGYVRPPGDGRRAIIEPREAQVVRVVFERYAAGTTSYREISDWLNAQDHRTRQGRPFSKNSIYEMLQNVAYAGYVGGQRAGLDEAARGEHEPIVSRELFERAAAIGHKRHRLKHATRPSRHVYLLSGTAVCARCGARLYGSRGGNGNRYARYLCANRSRRKTCDQPQALAREVETQLTSFLGDFRLDERHIEATLAKLRERFAAQRGREDAATEAAKLDARLRRLTELYELGDINRAEYQKRKRKLAALMPEIEPIPSIDLDRCVALLRNFRELWGNNPAEREKHRFVNLVFEQIAVDDRRLVSVKPRPEVLPLFVEREGVHSRGDWI